MEHVTHKCSMDFGLNGMKKVAAGFLFFALFSSAIFAQELELELRHRGIPHDSLYDICFSGENGFAVGMHGMMLLTQDAGLTWEVDTANSFDEALLGITCTSDKTVAVGQQGAMYIHDKAQWQKIEAVTEERLFSVALNEKGLGVAVGAFGVVLRTLDGGINWEQLSFDWEAILNDYVEPHVYDVSISESGVITIVGEFELVMQSADSGDEWTVSHQGDASLFGLHMSDSVNGFAVGQEGRILRTLDGGASWSALDSGVSNNLLDVWSSYQGEILITGIRSMLRSSDSGQTWTRASDTSVLTGWYQGIGVAMQRTELAGREITEEAVFVVGQAGEVLQIN